MGNYPSILPYSVYNPRMRMLADASLGPSISPPESPPMQVNLPDVAPEVMGQEPQRVPGAPTLMKPGELPEHTPYHPYISPYHQQIQDYLKTTTEYPRGADFQPTKMGRLGAFLTGTAAGPEAGRRQLFDPYQRQYQDWLTRTQAAKEAVKMPMQEEELRIAEEQARASAMSDYAKAKLYRAQTRRAELMPVSYGGEVYDIPSGQIVAQSQRLRPLNEQILMTSNAMNDPNASPEDRLSAKLEFDRLMDLHNQLGTITPFKEFMREHPNATVEDWLKASARPAFPRVMPVNDAAGNIVGYNVITTAPGGEDNMKFVPMGAGGAPTQGGVMPPKPTQPVLTQSQRSGMIQPEVENLIGQIDKLSTQIGPWTGRWNDFMVGRVGTDNPEFASLQMNLTLFTTALMLAHGLKGLSYQREIGAYLKASQSPDDLKARVMSANSWLQGYILDKKKGNNPSIPGTNVEIVGVVP